MTDVWSQRADAFREGTRGHDVTQNVDALLSHIDAAPPFCILDFGCGPGRDLATFTQLGHLAIGLEGAAPFAAMARNRLFSALRSSEIKRPPTAWTASAIHNVEYPYDVPTSSTVFALAPRISILRKRPTFSPTSSRKFSGSISPPEPDG